MAYIECAISSHRARPGVVPSLVEFFEARGRVRVLAPGQALYQQGDEASGINLVLSGLVGLRRHDENGEGALFDTRAKGDVVGHEAVLARAPHRSSAEALTLCRVSYVDRSQISQMLSASPSLHTELVRRVLSDNDKLQAKCVSLLAESLRTRLIKLLLSFHLVQGGRQTSGAFVVDVPLQRKDVAALIGAAPESLSRLLSKLEAEKAIRVDGRKIFMASAAAALNGAGGIAFKGAGADEALYVLTKARRALLAMIEAADGATRMALNAEVQRASADLEALIADMSGEASGAPAGFTQVWQRFKSTRQERIIPAIFAGEIDQAKRIATGVQAKRFEKMRALLTGPVRGENSSFQTAA